MATDITADIDTVSVESPVDSRGLPTRHARYETAFVGEAAKPYERNLGADAQDEETTNGA